MKKLSAELRIGLIAVLIIILFIWLFSFLKGRNLLSNSDQYTIIYDNIAGLEESSPVEISGFKIGIVKSTELINNGSGLITVRINVNRGCRIPVNSIAEITTETLIAGMKINLLAGDSKIYHNPGDTIMGRLAISILDKLDANFDPVLEATKGIIIKLDTLSTKLNALFTPEFISSLSDGAENIKEITLQTNTLLAANNENINSVLENLEEISRTIKNNNTKIDSTISSANILSTKLANSNIDSTIIALKETLKRTDVILTSLSQGQGTASMILNNDSLYTSLTGTLKSLNSLINDMENNPGRYVHFSLFGRKKNN